MQDVNIGQNRRAIADISEAIRIAEADHSPGECSYYEERGQLYERLGDKEKAKADYTKAIEHEREE